MKKTSRIISLILAFIMTAVIFATVVISPASAATSAIVDNKAAQVISGSAEGVSVALTWNLGYINVKQDGTDVRFEKTTSNTYSYSDVICVEKAGTIVSWVDEESSFINNVAFSVSTWVKNAEGYWEADPAGANYFGMNAKGSPIEIVTTDSSGDATKIEYRYVTSFDNECIRLGFRHAKNASCPEVTFTLSDEQGTFIKDCELNNAEVTFNNDGTITGINWFPGCIGNETSGRARKMIDYGYQQYAYSSIITIPKAGTTITFTDSLDVSVGSTQSYSNTKVYIVSHWKLEEGKSAYVFDEAALDKCYSGNSGNGVTSDNFTEIKNEDGSVTYTYTTTSDNEHIRLGYGTNADYGQIPANLPVVSYVAPAVDEPVTPPTSDMYIVAVAITAFVALFGVAFIVSKKVRA